MTADPEITLRLRRSLVETVLAQLHAGCYRDVAEPIHVITSQANPQLVAIAKIAEAESMAAPSELRQ